MFYFFSFLFSFSTSEVWARASAALTCWPGRAMTPSLVAGKGIDALARLGEGVVAIVGQQARVLSALACGWRWSAEDLAGPKCKKKKKEKKILI